MGGAIVRSAQSAIDPELVGTWAMGKNVIKHTMLMDSVGLFKNGKPSAAQRKVLHEFSAINHVDAEDPPVYLTVQASMDEALPCKTICIHHPEFGRMLKKAADKAGSVAIIEEQGAYSGDKKLRQGKWDNKIEFSKVSGAKEFPTPMAFIYSTMGVEFKPDPKAIKAHDFCGF